MKQSEREEYGVSKPSVALEVDKLAMASVSVTRVSDGEVEDAVEARSQRRR